MKGAYATSFYRFVAMFVIMNKKNKNKDDKPDIYDVLKDNPR